jgi:hypothetical protein
MVNKMTPTGTEGEMAPSGNWTVFMRKVPSFNPFGCQVDIDLSRLLLAVPLTWYPAKGQP